MDRVDLFYQCEGVGEIGQVEVGVDATFATVKAELVDRHSLGEDVILFLEDEDEPLDENSQVSDCHRSNQYNCSPKSLSPQSQSA